MSQLAYLWSTGQMMSRSTSRDTQPQWSTCRNF